MTTLVAAIILSQPALDAPRFAAEVAAGPCPSGRLVAVTAGWGVTLSDPVTSIKPGDLLSLVRADRPRPGLPGGPQLLLANGDRLPAVVAGGDDLAVRVRTTIATTADATWRIPLAQVRILWVDSPPAGTPADMSRYTWLDPGRKKDVVLLRNGDVVSGDIERFADDGKTLVWKPAGGKAGTTVELAAITAVAFNPTLVAARKPKGTFARIVTANGTRLTAATAGLEGTRLRGTTSFSEKFDLPIADLVALDVVQGKAVYLSDLKPRKAATEGYGDLAWPWVADRTAKQNPIRLATERGTETFDKGLGTHPKTTLSYELGSKYRRFEAIVGLDADTGRRGQARVAILVDGQERPVPGLDRLTSAGCVRVSVDVSKAKDLTLAIDFGPAGDVQADVNWANARLVE